MHKGSLVTFQGSWGSGLGFLHIRDAEDGKVRAVPCDNGSTVRALDAAFPGTIAAGHVVDTRAFAKREVYWDYDDLGLTLGWFVPVEDAPAEVEELYATKH